MNHFPCAAIIILFTGLTIAGFKGCLKPKRAIPKAQVEYVLSTNSFTHLAERAAIVGASLGYQAAQRGDSWEAVSNDVRKIFHQ